MNMKSALLIFVVGFQARCRVTSVQLPSLCTKHCRHSRSCKSMQRALWRILLRTLRRCGCFYCISLSFSLLFCKVQIITNKPPTQCLQSFNFADLESGPRVLHFASKCNVCVCVCVCVYVCKIFTIYFRSKSSLKTWQMTTECPR